MRMSLAIIEERIDKKRSQLHLVASGGQVPLTSDVVLKRSQELDVLINDYLKLKAGHEQANIGEVIDMLQTSHKYDQESPNKVTILLNGCLDIATIATLNGEMENIKEVSDIVIDFTNLTFIDSTGIGALLDIIYSSRQNNTRVDFYGLNEYIKEIFETVGITRVLEAVQRRG